MGILGLMKFVKERGALSPGRLRDCRLVVDGNLLCIFLYEASKAGWKYGGDYVTFGQEVKEVSATFLITPTINRKSSKVEACVKMLHNSTGPISSLVKAVH